MILFIHFKATFVHFKDIYLLKLHNIKIILAFVSIKINKVKFCKKKKSILCYYIAWNYLHKKNHLYISISL